MSEDRVPVLFLESRVAHGGDVQVLLDILGGLDLERFAPLVACVADGPVAGRSDLPAGVELMTLGFGFAEHGGVLAKLASLVSTTWALRREVAYRSIRVVHSNNTRRTLSVAVALKTLMPRQIRLVYHAHCEPQTSISHRSALKVASRVWTCSRFISDAYRAVGVPDAKLVDMPNGYDFVAPWPTPDKTIRHRLGVPDDAKLVVLVGRLSPVKGQHLAIEALGKLSSQPEAHLVLVGDDAIADRNEGYKEHLLALAAELQLRDRVHMVGFTKDPRPYYLAADVVLIPSHREPFGLTALEAAAGGRPIVATSSGGLIEVLGEVAGLELAAPDPDSLARLIGVAFAGAQVPTVDEVRLRLAAQYSMSEFVERVTSGILEVFTSPTETRRGRFAVRSQHRTIPS